MLPTNVKAPSTGTVNGLIAAATASAASNASNAVKTNTDVSNVAPVTENDETELKIPTKEDIEKKIEESEDVATALEAVGAMFGIPSTSFLQNCDANCIKVVDDTVIAPDNPHTKANTSSIVCAIGSVLDFISQRIDDKLNCYQKNAIMKDALPTKIQADANPAKGKVIDRVCDDEGNEIIIYDSGLCDIPNKESARCKYRELLSMNKIPEYNPDLLPCNMAPSYFNDEDDITADVNMSAGNDTSSGDDGLDTSDVSDSDFTESYVNIANEIDESEQILHLVEEFEHTTHLGYDIFSAIGFDCVKPIDSYIEESSKVSPRQ